MQQHATIAEATLIRNDNLRPIRRDRARPIHSTLASFSAAYFTGAFVTDLVYWQMPDVLWERFSIWLVTVGMILAGVAAIAGVIDLVSGRSMRNLAWPHAVGYVLAVGLSLINAFVHSRDGYTAIVPTGLALSALVVVILLFTGWFGSALVRRNLAGADR
jgi:uncharacterized membrane protein